MNPGTISNLASHLASDSYLTRRRSEIADCLEVSGGRRVQLGDLFQSGSYTPYEYFYELLEEWVGKKGPSATLEELAKIMRERQFNAFAGKTILVAINKMGFNLILEIDQFPMKLVSWSRYGKIPQFSRWF